MSSARTVTVSEFKTRLNYELRNSYEVEWITAEVLSYINKWNEFIYMLLAEHESDLVMTGSGSFTTSEGVERYLLADNSMGDLWTIPGCEDADDSNVRLSGLGGLELCEKKERTEHLIAKDQGSSSYSQPSKFYLHNGYIGLLPFPDSTVYTVYIEDYIPNFTPLADENATMPYQNLFNIVFEEGAKIVAKNREGYGSATDAVLMELFQDRAMSIIRQRQKQNNCLVSGY